jgi:hypothetical protein
MRTLASSLVVAPVAALLLTTGGASARPAVEPVEIDVDGDRLCLRDLMPALPDELAMVDLGPTPPPGQTRALSRGTVLRQLHQANAQIQDLELPPLWRVRRPAQNVSAGEIKRLVSAAITSVLPDGLRLRQLAVPGGMVLPRGALNLRVRPAAPWRSGSQTVAVDVGTDTSLSRPIAVTADLEGTVKRDRVVMTRGCEIQIVARTLGLLVRATGIAQQSGAEGDVIAVLPNVGQKVIKARVQDAHTVEVEL